MRASALWQWSRTVSCVAMVVAVLSTTRCAGTAPAATTPSSLPQGSASATDNFERTDLGQNWIVYNGAVGIVNASDLGVLSVSGGLLGLGIVAWNAAVVSADQFSEGLVSADADPRIALQVFVRRRTSDNQRYGFHWNPAGQWEIKRDGGPAAPVLASTAGTALAPGDLLRIEVRGSVIQAFRNGTLMVTASDTVLADTGRPGMALNVASVSRFPTPCFESWRGGSLD